MQRCCGLINVVITAYYIIFYRKSQPCEKKALPGDTGRTLFHSRAAVLFPIKLLREQ